MTKPFRLITLLGPTAVGKTRLAALLAHALDGEVISADSRQVYRRMDIGTGKDVSDYVVDGKIISHHLTDVAEPGEAYDLYRFLQDFRSVFADIIARSKVPILCGGSGMYLEAVIAGYGLHHAPQDPELRNRLETLPDEQLIAILTEHKQLHNTTDTGDRLRLIRAVEIALQAGQGEPADQVTPEIDHLVLGLQVPRDEVRKRITQRLHQRLKEGLVEEVSSLLDEGITPGQMRYYGLEYRYVTDYITSVTSYNEMVNLLNTAIHQFAKRQMTWFRRMEKKGIKIHWIDGMKSEQDRLNDALKLWQSFSKIND